MNFCNLVDPPVYPGSQLFYDALGAPCFTLRGIQGKQLGFDVCSLLGNRIEADLPVLPGAIALDLRSRLGFWVTGAVIFGLWNLTTLAGAILGNALGDPRAWGLDAAPELPPATPPPAPASTAR